jgi:hypothetical protein
MAVVWLVVTLIFLIICVVLLSLDKKNETYVSLVLSINIVCLINVIIALGYST